METTQTIPVSKRVDKIMVFKPVSKLNPATKRLSEAGYAPKGEQNVIVLKSHNKGEEIYLTVKYIGTGGSRVCELNRRHFWTVAQHKTYLKKQVKLN